MSQKTLCTVSDLIQDSGVCALIKQRGRDQQLALFYVPSTEQQVFAIGNWDPLGNANVMSRGIVGNVGDELVVASPLYKQHFSLTTGQCLEEDASVPVYPVAIEGDNVVLLT